MDLDLLAGEGANGLTANAEDAAHVHYPLKVEYVGQVPNLSTTFPHFDPVRPGSGDFRKTKGSITDLEN